MRSEQLMTIKDVVGKQYLSFFSICVLLLSVSVNTTAQVLSNSAVKPISKAQELMSEGQYNVAAENLSAFLAKERLKDYDRAKALQLLAIVYMNLDDNKNAIEKIEEALSLQALELVSASQLRQNLFSLYAMMESYDKAIDHLNIWFADQEKPSAQMYFLAGRIYGLSERWSQASDFIEKGYALSKQDVNATPERSWMELTLTVRMQLNQHQQARTLLEEMISIWPDRYAYYQQLSGVYHTLKKEKDSFAIMSIARQNQLLESKNDLERLAQLYRYFDNPYPAARILEGIVLSKDFEKNELFYENLANAWLQAREWTQAESALYEAANLSDDGEHWLRLCQSNFQRDDVKNAMQYCDKALAKGGLEKDTPTAWYLLALSKHRLEDREGALHAFKQCQNIETGNAACTSWLKVYADNEKRRKYEAEILREAELKSRLDNQRQNDRIENAINRVI